MLSQVTKLEIGWRRQRVPSVAGEGNSCQLLAKSKELSI